MNTKLKQAMQNLVEAVDLAGAIQTNAHMMAGFEGAALQAAEDLLVEARTALGDALKESGYPHREWTGAEGFKHHLVHGADGVFAARMAEAAAQLKQQLVYRDGSVLFRAFPEEPGKWEKIMVIKAPADTNAAPFANVVYETPPPSAVRMPIAIYAPSKDGMSGM